MRKSAGTTCCFSYGTRPSEIWVIFRYLRGEIQVLQVLVTPECPESGHFDLKMDLELALDP